MSELIDNSRNRVDTLKSLIMKLHLGFSPDETKKTIRATAWYCPIWRDCTS